MPGSAGAPLSLRRFRFEFFARSFHNTDAGPSIVTGPSSQSPGRPRGRAEAGPSSDRVSNGTSPGLMLWHLQIDPAPGQIDLAGRRVAADAGELGLPSTPPSRSPRSGRRTSSKPMSWTARSSTSCPSRASPTPRPRAPWPCWSTWGSPSRMSGRSGPIGSRGRARACLGWSRGSWPMTRSSRPWSGACRSRSSARGPRIDSPGSRCRSWGSPTPSCSPSARRGSSTSACPSSAPSRPISPGKAASRPTASSRPWRRPGASIARTRRSGGGSTSTAGSSTTS